MSTWSSFTTTAAQIKQREAQLFGAYADNDAIAIMQTVAKDEMIGDLMQALGVTSATESSLETALDDHTEVLQRALAFKQLALWFIDNDHGADSVNRAKAEHYASRYKDEAVRFRTLASRTANIIPAYR